jgi:hypothetical protein
MPKFLNSPGVLTLSRLSASEVTLPAGTALARIYYTWGEYSQTWQDFRYIGPLNSRWDHHLPNAAGKAVRQTRGVFYAATAAKTCLAEVFQTTRRIDRARNAPWLVVFRTAAPLLLLNLTGDFATRMGASMAIHSGHRGRTRGWARDLYAAFPTAQGILYAASMHGGEPAVALNERALRVPLFPSNPVFNRALADAVLLDPLKHAAAALGYRLR